MTVAAAEMSTSLCYFSAPTSLSWRSQARMPRSVIPRLKGDEVGFPQVARDIDVAACAKQIRTDIA